MKFLNCPIFFLNFCHPSPFTSFLFVFMFVHIRRTGEEFKKTKFYFSSFTDTQGQQPSRSNTPLQSPFPIIPPPTPFTEESLSGTFPVIPARNVLSKSTNLRLVLAPSRNDSFTAALKGGADIEMQALHSPVEDHAKVTEEDSPVYDTVRRLSPPTSSHVIVEADVHAPHRNHNGYSEERVYDAVPVVKPKMSHGLAKLAVIPPAMPLQNSAVCNQMYFDMGGSDVRDSPATPSRNIQAPRKPACLAKPVPLHPSQIQVRFRFLFFVSTILN